MRIAKWYHAIKGYLDYQTLPLRPTVEGAACLSHCVACESHKLMREDDLPVEIRGVVHYPRSLWCGDPLVSVPGKSCGCVVGAESLPGDPVHVILTHRGEPIKMQVAFKTEVKSPCPRGFF